MDIQEIVELSKAYPELAQAQHFFVGKDIVEFAQSNALDSDDECIRIPVSARLPCRLVTMSIDLNGYDNVLVFLRESTSRGNGLEIISSIILADSYREVLGSWHPGSEKITAIRENYVAAIGMLAFIVALINEPRVLAKTPQGTRQVRRQAHRGGGFAVDAWTRVSWDLSKATAAKIARDPTFHKVPLHWRRGHYRMAKEHYKGAIQRPDAIRPEDRGMWWQWIEGMHVGHPIFGIKRSKYAPRLTGADIARRAGSKLAMP